MQVPSRTWVTDIAGGYFHALALKNDGTVWGWGSNSSGQLGDCWNDFPRLGSVVGYDTVQAIAAMLRRAGGTGTDAMAEAMRGLAFPGVFGEIEFREIDHQSTMGAFVGRTVLRNGRGAMADWRYADGRNYLPADDVVRQLRPAQA